MTFKEAINIIVKVFLYSRHYLTILMVVNPESMLTKISIPESVVARFSPSPDLAMKYA